MSSNNDDLKAYVVRAQEEKLKREETKKREREAGNAKTRAVIEARNNKLAEAVEILRGIEKDLSSSLRFQITPQLDVHTGGVAGVGFDVSLPNNARSRWYMIESIVSDEVILSCCNANDHKKRHSFNQQFGIKNLPDLTEAKVKEMVKAAIDEIYE